MTFGEKVLILYLYDRERERHENDSKTGDEKASDFRSAKCDGCCLCSYSNPQLRRPNHDTRRNADGSE